MSLFCYLSMLEICLFPMLIYLPTKSPNSFFFSNRDTEVISFCFLFHITIYIAEEKKYCNLYVFQYRAALLWRLLLSADSSWPRGDGYVSKFIVLISLVERSVSSSTLSLILLGKSKSPANPSDTELTRGQ